MTQIETTLLLLGAVVLLAGAARAIAAPYPVVLLLGGLALGFIPGAPSPELDPDVVFFVFLPPLLYSAAFLATGPDLRRHAVSLGTLAVGLVLATACAVALVAHHVAGLPWSVAFVLGAVLGPTDPVSATAIVRRVGAPRRIETVLEGEALINDGTGLTAYTVAVGVVGAGAFSLGDSALKFVGVAAGGAAIGVAVGLLSTVVRRRIDDPNIEISLALVTAYAAYIAADHAGTSGILGAVAAGVAVQRRAESHSAPGTRLQSEAFWEVVTFLLNALLFLLVGLQFSAVLDGIEGRATGELVLGAAAVGATVMLLRLGWMLTMTPFVARAADAEGPDRGRLRREQLVMGWSGMRGALSLAAALAIPLRAGGEPFPERSLVIFLTYTAILVTLVLPALSLPKLLERLGLGGEQRGRETIEARRRLAHAALERLESLARDEHLPEPVAGRLRGIHEARLERLEDGAGGADDERDSAVERRIRQALVEAQRDQLRRLRGEGLPADIVREIQRDLDLEESRLTRA
jgi:Na+/H+ antiporter